MYGMKQITKKQITGHLVKPAKSDLDQPMKILHTFLDIKTILGICLNSTSGERLYLKKK